MDILGSLGTVQTVLLAVLALVLIVISVSWLMKNRKNPDPGETAQGVGSVLLALIPAVLAGGLGIVLVTNGLDFFGLGA